MYPNEILNKNIGTPNNRGHHMLIRDRKMMEITGIKKLESLNSEEFVLETTLGYMTISGNDLEMINLNMEKGEISLSGYVTKIEYYDYQEGKEANQKGFLSKLFK